MGDGVAVAWVLLQPWGDGDLGLLRRINAPEMMEHLGGPETEEQILRRHKRYVAGGANGTDQMFRVVLLPQMAAVGSIGYWERQWCDQTVYETGWSILPEYQGRGLAAAAATAVVDDVRKDLKHRYMHAFPAVGNPPSNAVCRKLGFVLLASHDFEYPPGHTMYCNDWRLDLHEVDAA